MAPNYDFLNNYVSNLVANTQNPDESPLEDDSDLYDVQDEDDQPSPDQDNGGYGFEEQSDDEDQQYQNDDTPMGYTDEDYENDPASGGGLPESAAAPSDLGKSISGIESGGKYNATNKHSSAVGKYQFLWSAWGDSIKKVTGVGSKDEFLHSPKAQEKYYGWYEKHYLMPQVEKLRQYNKAGLSDQQLAKLVHYRGAGGAKKYLQGQLADKTEKYNMPISKYIAQHQTGGSVEGGLYNKNKTQYVDSVLNANRNIEWVNRLYKKNAPNIQVEGEPYKSTHLMSDDGNGYVFPRIQMINGKLKDLGNGAEDYARRTNTGIQLPKQQGSWFAANGYKQGTGVLPDRFGFQNGGKTGIANDNSSQFIGLNNEDYDSMYFPMNGENEFRGLDDGTPVYLEDEKGTKKVLKGKRDRVKMHGNVFEKRINK